MVQNNQINVPTPFAINKGGTGVTSVTTAPTASAWAGWDANKNLSANNHIQGYTTTVTAAGTTVLTVASTWQQYFTGSTTQTVTLPVTSTLVLGQSFFIVNNSSNAVTVNSSGGNAVQVMTANTTALVTCILTSGTTAASWSVDYTTPSSGANFPVNTNITSMTGLTGTLQAPTGITSSTGANLLGFTYTASAVNYLQVTNNATGFTPAITATGSDSNVGLSIVSKGTGSINFLGSSGATNILLLASVASATNYWLMLNNTTGNDPTLQATGTDAAVAAQFQSKGGVFKFLDGLSASSAVIRYYNGAASQYTGLTVATAQATTVTFTLPAADGAAGTALKTNGSAVLGFTTAAVVTQVVVQTFGASGTYTPTSGMKYCTIECWGGGGAGGGVASSAATSAVAGGGGAGSYSRKTSTAATIGASQTVTCGAGGTAGAAGNNPGGNGGDTSVGSICIGKGGTGGSGAAVSTASAGGAGGVAGTGDITGTGMPGGSGPTSITTATGSANGGNGGSTLIGGGGAGAISSGTGGTATGNGSGGGGAAQYNNAGAAAGGAGKIGYVVITEFLSV